MTNTFPDRIAALLDELDFKADPGFSGYPSLYNERGDGVLVVVAEADELRLQLYRTDGPGSDFELLRDEEVSMREAWGEFSEVHSERRLRDLTYVLSHIEFI